MSNEQVTQEPPEDSIALRIVVFAMAIICVAASCFFVRTHIAMVIGYAVAIVVGSFLSYKFREEDPRWLKIIWWVGILAVGGYAIHDFTGPLRDEFDFVSPFVHFLSGIFVFITFSMRSRSDLNLASGLGLVLLCMIAPVAKGLGYGACVLAYLCLGACMLYYDCVSRTLTSWLSRTITKAPEIPMYSIRRGRMPRGNTVMLLAALPLAALAAFLYVPRADKMMDEVWAYGKTMDPGILADAFMAANKPPPPDENRTHTARTWFNKNTDVMKNVNQQEKKREKKEKDEKLSDEEVASKIKQSRPGQKQGPADKAEAKAAKPNRAGKPAGSKTPKGKSAKEEASGKSPTADATEQTEGAEGDPASPPDAKDSEKGKKVKGKDGKDSKKAGAGKDSKKAGAGKDKESSSDAKKGEDGDTESGAAEKGSKRSGKNSKAKKGDGDGDGDGDGLGSGSGKGKGRNAGKGSGKGKDKAGSGKGSAGGGKIGKGKGNAGSDDISLGGDDELDLENQLPPGNGLILIVKSRRLVYLRRECYDFYTGRTWKKSDRKKKWPIVKFVDGIRERDLEPIKPAPTPKPKAVEQVPAGVPAQTPNVLAPGMPSGNGGILASGGSGPSTVLASGGGGQTPGGAGQGGTIASGSSIQLGGGSGKQDATQSTGAPVGGSKMYDTTRDAQSKFVFERKEDRPIFRISAARSLKIQRLVPTLDLLQEVKVKAKSIGKIVPAGWIPQEVKIDQNKVEVDPYGVITSEKAILQNTEFKVKTELPIYPLEAMRKALPATANEEDAIRTEHAKFLQLPKTVSDEMFKLAEDNSDPRFNWFMQCEQIANFLRQHYEYDAMREVDPESKDMVQDFLFERKTGHCTDFASAFVMMTRCVGIPSRMISGFKPGEQNLQTGDREIRQGDIHHWAEAYIPTFGWVPFDPTPDGFLPAQQREENYTMEVVKKQLNVEKKDLFGIKLSDIITWLVSALISLVVGFFAFKLLVRLYRKWRSMMRGRGPEWRLYRKVAKNIKSSIKVTRAPAETPSEFMERVRNVVVELKRDGKTVPEGLPDAVDIFMKTYSEVYFGRRMEQMENLKYHAEQVAQNSKVKVKIQADADNAVRAKKDDDGAGATSASANSASASASALRRMSSKADDAVRRKKD